MRPILIHIGYHKTGTNWLPCELFDDADTGYRWLGKRPEARWALVSGRALEFDAAEVRASFASRLAKADERDLVPVVSLERLSGHPFAGGHDSSQIAERLRAVFPEGRVLAIIREQRSMIVSTYKQYVKAGGAVSLEQFLHPPSRQNWRVPGFDFRHFEYEHLIGKYHRLYGLENVLVLPYEQFVRDGRDFAERIAGFAGRPIPAKVLDRLSYSKRYNESPSATTVAAPLEQALAAHRAEPRPARAVATGRAARRPAEGIRRPLRRARTRARRTRGGAPPARGRGDGRRALREEQRAQAALADVDLTAYGWPVAT